MVTEMAVIDINILDVKLTPDVLYLVLSSESTWTKKYRNRRESIEL